MRFSRRAVVLRAVNTSRPTPNSPQPPPGATGPWWKELKALNRLYQSTSSNLGRRVVAERAQQLQEDLDLGVLILNYILNRRDLRVLAWIGSPLAWWKVPVRKEQRQGSGRQERKGRRHEEVKVVLAAVIGRIEQVNRARKHARDRMTASEIEDA